MKAFVQRTVDKIGYGQEIWDLHLKIETLPLLHNDEYPSGYYSYTVYSLVLIPCVHVQVNNYVFLCMSEFCRCW